MCYFALFLRKKKPINSISSIRVWSINCKCTRVFTLHSSSNSTVVYQNDFFSGKRQYMFCLTLGGIYLKATLYQISAIMGWRGGPDCTLLRENCIKRSDLNEALRGTDFSGRPGQWLFRRCCKSVTEVLPSRKWVSRKWSFETETTIRS